jgi:large subunit ribosomal protein L18
MLKSIQKKKNRVYIQRKRRSRANIHGTAEKPRVTVFRSNKHFYAQAIDDDAGHTLAYSDGNKLGVRSTREGAQTTAKDLAEKLKAAGIETIVFDRNGYLYHGVVAAFADGLREAGIKF